MEVYGFIVSGGIGVGPAPGVEGLKPDEEWEGRVYGEGSIRIDEGYMFRFIPGGGFVTENDGIGVGDGIIGVGNLGLGEGTEVALIACVMRLDFSASRSSRIFSVQWGFRL